MKGQKKGKNPRLCQWKSCRRQTDRHAGMSKSFCRRHQRKDNVTYLTPPTVVPVPKPIVSKKEGIVHQVTVPGWTVRKALEWRTKLEKKLPKTKANRVSVPLVHQYQKKWVQEIIEATTDSLEGIIGKFTIIENSADAIAAPPTNHRWVKGKLHRDCALSEAPRQYTFIFFIDETNENNGNIELYRDSCGMPAYERDGGRLFEKMKAAKIEMEKITAKSGTLLVFDSRCLHQSMPNMTDATRWTLNWLVEV